MRYLEVDGTVNWRRIVLVVHVLMMSCDEEGV